MKKIYIYIPLIAASIIFIIGFLAVKRNDFSTAVLFLSLSIILFVSAGTLKISMKIDELKEKIKNKQL